MGWGLLGMYQIEISRIGALSQSYVNVRMIVMSGKWTGAIGGRQSIGNETRAGDPGRETGTAAGRRDGCQRFIQMPVEALTDAVG